MSGDDTLERIAAQHYREEFRRSAGSQEREIWIQAARLYFRPETRQPCFVCGKFASIAEAHHVIPLVSQYYRGFEVPNNEHVWLCPNHHAILHAFIPAENRSMNPAAFRRRNKRSFAVHDDVSDDELRKLLDLMQRSGGGPSE